MKIQGISLFTINDDLSVDVPSDVIIRHNPIPVQFNIVDGTFNCSGLGLSTLKGSPRRCKSFHCGYNKLLTLEYGPIATEDYTCCSNSLTSLKGCPRHLHGNFDCSNNKLLSLKGCPFSVKGKFICSKNLLRNLDYLPNSIKSLNCGCNQISKLPELPSKMDELILYDNNLYSLKGCPKEINDALNIINNKELKSLKHLPIIHGELFCPHYLQKTTEYKRWKTYNILKNI